MNVDALKAMSRPELVEFAGKQGVRVHHKAKPAAAAPVKPVDHNTAEAVEAAIKHIKDARPEFVSSYNATDNSWTFKYRGAEECGNLSIPLRIIVIKATNVARGALRFMALNEHFDAGSAGGKNTYTNNVLPTG